MARDKFGTTADVPGGSTFGFEAKGMGTKAKAATKIMLLLLVGSAGACIFAQGEPSGQTPPPQGVAVEAARPLVSPDQARELVLQSPPSIEFERWRPAGTEEFLERFEVSFPSSFASGSANNDRVLLRVTLPTERVGPVPVVILLHYWGATDLRLEATFAERLAQVGIASVAMPLPYHLDRTPEGFRSGELAVRPDIGLLRATMAQTVQDVRRTIDWIQTRPELRGDAISLGGTSLGSIVGTLCFAVEPRIRSGVFLLGGVDLAEILWSSSRVVPVRDALRRQGYTLDRLRGELESVEPLTYLRTDDTRPVLMVVGRYDTIVPPNNAQKLVDRLPQAKLLALDTGHFGGFLVESRLVDIARRFHESTLTGRAYNPPGRVFAPTIRVGLQANTETALQIALGLDVWRSNDRSDAFGSVLATPRGIQAFVGYRLNRDVSLGVSFTPKRPSPCLLWSVVL